MYNNMFSSPIIANNYLTCTGLPVNYGALHTYPPDIFESATFYFRIQKYADSLPNSPDVGEDGSHIRKEKVADSKIPGYVWMGRNTSVHPGTVRLTHSSRCLSSCKGFGASFGVFTVLTALYLIHQSSSPYTVLATCRITPHVSPLQV